jgi:molybdopterin/thiamine biosynthesis adenylyltransferase
MGAAHDALAAKRVLVIGAGGLGCPAAAVIARSGVGHVTLLDDDRVEESNLHRQTLYVPSDGGQPKAPLAAAALIREASRCGFELQAVARESRFLPQGAVEAVRGFDLVLEGADNFATKFLVADACALAGVPVVQAGAVRWVGWALASVPGQSACLRCVFEDVPRGTEDTCAAAGVVGPVVGVLGALQSALALRLLLGDVSAAGELWSYAALPGSLRRKPVARQHGCALCSGRIHDTDVSRYAPPECAA